MSHLLKVTEFLVKISQFKLWVMTEKNNFIWTGFFCHYIFQILVIFYEQTASPPGKSLPSFPATALSKLRSCQAPPFWKFGLVWDSPPTPPPPTPFPAQQNERRCTIWYISSRFSIGIENMGKVWCCPMGGFQEWGKCLDNTLLKEYDFQAKLETFQVSFFIKRENLLEI